MERRLELHEKLCGILGSENVYFQPPETVKMQYPCIVYSRNRMNITWADDMPYDYRMGYTVTVIDSNPDSLIPTKLLSFLHCSFDRHFTENQLNHDVYSIFY